MAIHVDLSSTVFGSTRPWKGENKTYIASYEIDFSTTGYDLAQNEIMKIATIPAGTVIASAMVKVLTAEAEITDVDIGVGTTTTVANIFDGISMASTGWLAANNLTTTYGGTYQTTESALLFTNKDAQTLDTAKIVVIIEFVDFAQAIV